MTIHHFQPTHYHNTLGTHEPVLRIADGDTVITSTADAHGRNREMDTVAEAPNPQTGPFYVEGAEPGDTLVMTLDRLVPNRTYGYTRTLVAPNVIDPDYVSQMPYPPPGEKPLAGVVRRRRGRHGDPDRAGDTAGTTDAAVGSHAGLFRRRATRGEAILASTAGPHGGNMDYRGHRSGVTAYFPVGAPGALVFVGDGHAVQGDGEIVGTGIEISFDVQFTVRLIKGKQIHWPRGEDTDSIFTVGNARPLDQAVQHATTEMLRWLIEDYGLDPIGASTLLGQCVRYDLGNIYDPAYTMVCKLAKRWLPV